MRQFYAYIRVSTVKQGEKGSSLQEQRDAIKAFATRHGLEIITWFEERETAAKLGRGEFNRMLALLNRGKASGVIFHKIDRGARNLKDWNNIQELNEQGIDVRFAHESIDLTTREGRLTGDLLAVVAADYIRNLRNEVKKGLQGRLKQGLYPFRAPVGYRDCGKALRKEIHPVAGPLVRQAFELYATGTYGFHRLRDELLRRGLKTAAGRPLSLCGLTTMLRNPFYVGVIRIKRTGQTFPGVHQPLIRKALFDRVQAILDGKLSARPIKHDLLFRRLLRCAFCGYALIGEVQKGITYYRCHTKGCGTKGIREDAVSEALERLFAPFKFSDSELKELDQYAHEFRQDWARRRTDDLRAAKLALAALDDRLARLTDAFVDGLIDKDIFGGRKERLLVERAAARQEIGDLEAGRDLVSDRVSEFLERASTLWLSYESSLPFQKREILGSITSNFSIEGKNLVVALKSPFAEIITALNSSDGAPYRDRPRTSDSHVLRAIKSYFSTLQGRLAHPPNQSSIKPTGRPVIRISDQQARLDQ